MDEWKLYSISVIPKDWYAMDLFQTPESDDCNERTLNLSRFDGYLAKVLEMWNAADEMKYNAMITDYFVLHYILVQYDNVVKSRIKFLY